MTTSLRLFFLPAALFFFLSGSAYFASAEDKAGASEGSGNSIVISEGADDLRQLIDERSKELEKIQEEREKLEGEIENINETQRSLKRDLGRIDYNIRQLDLSVKSSKVSIEKLNLEVSSLNQDVRKIEKSIDDKKETIGKLLFELYQRDKDDFLVVFLKSRTLADGVSEVQSIVILNSDLTVSIDELKSFRGQLVQKTAYAQQKKRDKEREKTNLENRQYIVQDQKQEKQRLLSRTNNQEKVYEEQLTELDKQQDEISEAIEEVEHKLRASFDPSLLPLKRPGVLAYPVPDPYVTQKYGETAFARRAYRTKFHIGTDFRARVGTPVFSAERGEVTAVDDNGRLQFGRYVSVRHGNNLTTLYSHLSRSIVKAGDSVEKGDVIGYSGNTGYTTGPHLHLGVYWSQSFQLKKFPSVPGLVPVGVHVDPEEYL